MVSKQSIIMGNLLMRSTNIFHIWAHIISSNFYLLCTSMSQPCNSSNAQIRIIIIRQRNNIIKKIRDKKKRAPVFQDTMFQIPPVKFDREKWDSAYDTIQRIKTAFAQSNQNVPAHLVLFWAPSFQKTENYTIFTKYLKLIWI